MGKSATETGVLAAEMDSDSGKSVLERATTILACFDHDMPGCTLKDLCERTGLPKSTVHRFAERLVEMGWLERLGGEYMIGIGLFEIGNLADRYFRLRMLALPYLHHLSATTRCATQLAVLRGTNVEYLEIVPYRSFQPPSHEGGLMPAYCTALGKAILAFAPPADLERALDVQRVRRTPYTLVSNGMLRDELARIRATGVAIDREESFRGISCVAAGIGGDGRTLAAISACGRSVPFDAPQIANQVRRCAAAIRGRLTATRGNATRSCPRYATSAASAVDHAPPSVSC